MNAVAFESLTGFSKLFTDFVAERGLMPQRFPANQLLYSNSIPLQARAAANTHRAVIQEAIRTTMHHEALTVEQEATMRLLGESTTLTVITGQQLGLLGGPLYTMLKAWSAVEHAKRLTAAHDGLRFVPVFWIEDNDHDVDETAHVGMIDAGGEAYTLHSPWKNVPERTPVSELRLQESVIASIDAAKDELPSSEFTFSVIQLLDAAYTVGASATSAFLHLLQAVLGKTGMLFVSAAELRQRGLFAGIARQELENVGRTAAAVEQASAELREHGYHAQAEATPVNLFLYSMEGRRHKINPEADAETAANGETRFRAGNEKFTLAEILTLTETAPERFSSSVFLRPLVQDSVFPNAAYVAGPGEIAYMAQMKELYELFGVPATATIARHSATLLDSRTAEFLRKRGMEPSAVMRPYTEVEKAVLHDEENKYIAELLTKVRLSTEAMFGELLPLIAALDASLAPTTDRTKNQALKQLETLAVKVRRAEKRLHETTFSRLKKAHALLFPEDGLQERALPYLYFAAKVGLDALAAQMSGLTAQLNDRHYVVDIE
jgi:bacillithiol synthase